VAGLVCGIGVGGNGSGGSLIRMGGGPEGRVGVR
jgi:hypothetical protein